MAFALFLLVNAVLFTLNITLSSRSVSKFEST